MSDLYCAAMRALLHGSESTTAQHADGLQVLPADTAVTGHENQHRCIRLVQNLLGNVGNDSGERELGDAKKLSHLNTRC